jgi:hypothetical protein
LHCRHNGDKTKIEIAAIPSSAIIIKILVFCKQIGYKLYCYVSRPEDNVDDIYYYTTHVVVYLLIMLLWIVVASRWLHRPSL